MAPHPSWYALIIVGPMIWTALYLPQAAWKMISTKARMA
jgi:hypothetical protein